MTHKLFTVVNDSNVKYLLKVTIQTLLLNKKYFFNDFNPKT